MTDNISTSSIPGTYVSVFAPKWPWVVYKWLRVGEISQQVDSISTRQEKFFKTRIFILKKQRQKNFDLGERDKKKQKTVAWLCSRSFGALIISEKSQTSLKNDKTTGVVGESARWSFLDVNSAMKTKHWPRSIYMYTHSLSQTPTHTHHAWCHPCRVEKEPCKCTHPRSHTVITQTRNMKHGTEIAFWHHTTSEKKKRKEKEKKEQKLQK